MIKTLVPKDGGPAFPIDTIESTDEGRIIVAKGGMSLRDYFAAAALSGILAKGTNEGRQWDNSYYSQVAAMSYQVADSMLAERSKA